MTESNPADLIKSFDFSAKLTAEELDYIEWALGNLNEDHKRSLDEWLESELVDDNNDLEAAKKALAERYANEFGAHEAADRSWLAMEHWQEYIQDHPVVLMDEKAYRLASLVTHLMAEVYQIVGCKYWPEDQEKKNE